MIHGMPAYLTRDSLNIGITGYADDTTVHVKEKNLKDVTAKLEILGENMIQYCNENELIINAKKTQILTSAKQVIKVRIGKDTVPSSKTISLLGLEYDENFSTAPKLACKANTRAALIKRLSYGMPNCVLKPLANGLLMGKILAAAPAAIPIRLNTNDKPYLSGILTEIDKSIRATARTITRTSLNDKVRTETVLWKAGLRSLTQAVSETMACSIWKAQNDKNPLRRIYQNKVPTRNTRS